MMLSCSSRKRISIFRASTKFVTSRKMFGKAVDSMWTTSASAPMSPLLNCLNKLGLSMINLLGNGETGLIIVAFSGKISEISRKFERI